MAERVFKAYFSGEAAAVSKSRSKAEMEIRESMSAIARVNVMARGTHGSSIKGCFSVLFDGFTSVRAATPAQAEKKLYKRLLSTNKIAENPFYPASVSILDGKSRVGSNFRLDATIVCKRCKTEYMDYGGGSNIRVFAEYLDSPCTKCMGLQAVGKKITLTRGDEPYNYWLFFKTRTGKVRKKLIAKGYAMKKARPSKIHLPVDWYDDSIPYE